MLSPWSSSSLGAEAWKFAPCNVVVSALCGSCPRPSVASVPMTTRHIANYTGTAPDNTNNNRKFLWAGLWKDGTFRAAELGQY
jgi:hypothetical protein